MRRLCLFWYGPRMTDELPEGVRPLSKLGPEELTTMYSQECQEPAQDQARPSVPPSSESTDSPGSGIRLEMGVVRMTVERLQVGDLLLFTGTTDYRRVARQMGDREAIGAAIRSQPDREVPVMDLYPLWPKDGLREPSLPSLTSPDTQIKPDHWIVVTSDGTFIASPMDRVKMRRPTGVPFPAGAPKEINPAVSPPTKIEVWSQREPAPKPLRFLQKWALFFRLAKGWRATMAPVLPQKAVHVEGADKDYDKALFEAQVAASQPGSWLSSLAVQELDRVSPWKRLVRAWNHMLYRLRVKVR